MNEIGIPPLEPHRRRRRERARARPGQSQADPAPAPGHLAGTILSPRDTGADLAIPLTIAAAVLLTAVFALAVLV